MAWCGYLRGEARAALLALFLEQQSRGPDSFESCRREVSVSHSLLPSPLFPHSLSLICCQNHITFLHSTPPLHSSPIFSSLLLSSPLLSSPLSPDLLLFLHWRSKGLLYGPVSLSSMMGTLLGLSSPTGGRCHGHHPD